MGSDPREYPGAVRACQLAPARAAPRIAGLDASGWVREGDGDERRRRAVIRAGKGGVYVDVWPKPGAKRDEPGGWHEGALRAAVKAPPVEGKANAALEALLAATFGVPRGAVSVARGGKSRRKSVFIEGVDAARASAALPPEA